MALVFGCFLGLAPLQTGLTTSKPAKPAAELTDVIPYSAGITAESALKDETLGEWLTDFEPQTADYAFIAVAYLHHARLGDQSHLEPWLQAAAAAATPDLPLLWDADAQAELAESTTTPFAERLAAVADDYAWLRDNVFDAAPMVFPATVFSESSFREAVAIAIARSVVVEEEAGAVAVLLPPLDRAEREAEPSAQALAAKARDGGFFGVGGEEAAGVKLVATRALAEGDAVTLGLPGGTSGEALVDLGVISSPVPVEVALTFELDPDDINAYDKEEVLQREDIEPSQTFLLTEADPLPADLVAFLRLCLLGGADAFLLESVFSEVLWNEHLVLPVSEENERAALERVSSTVEAALRGLRSTMRDDLGVIASEPSRQTIAYRLAAVRYAERRALQATLDEAQRQLRSLDELEYYQQRRLRLLNLTPIETEEELNALRAAGRAMADGNW